jgi:hypothetical protein
MTGATIHRAVERTGCFSAEQAFSQSIGTSELPIVNNYIQYIRKDVQYKRIKFRRLVLARAD